MKVRKYISRLLSKNKFIHSVSILAAGSASGQALVILASPLITRLYAPDDFGILSVLIALIMLASVVSSLRYELAIPIADKDEEAILLVVLSFIITGISTVLLSIVFLIFTPWIEEIINIKGIGSYFWLIPIGNACIGTYQILNYWAIRKKNFNTIARTKIVQGGATVFVQITCYVFGVLGLLIGYIAGQSAGITSLGYPLFKDTHRKLDSGKNLSNILKIGKRYKKFPLFSTWAGLLNTCGSQSPNLLFATLFSITEAGSFTLANRVLTLPLSLVGMAVGNTFFSEASEAHKKGNLASLSTQVSTILFSTIFPPMILVSIFGGQVFPIIFGPNWERSGLIVQYLALMSIFQFCVSPIGQILAITENQRIGMILQGILLAFRLGAICIGYIANNFMLAIMMYSILSSIGYILFLLFSLVSANSNIKSYITNISGIAIKVLLCYLPLIASVLFLKEGLYIYILTFISIILIIKFHYLNYKSWQNS